MNTPTAMTLFFSGLVLTMFGVGGVENSIEADQLLVSLGVCTLGLLAMFAATQAMKVTSYYD